MRHWSIIIVLTFSFFYSFGQSKLSEQAQISLLTCSPGSELYALFGHSAIRVNDPVTGFDKVFNYGTFDFDTPNFYLKFANGNLNYWLTHNEFSNFKRKYDYFNQSVTEYPFNLSQIEKQGLFDAIVVNLQPDNKYYRYDFFFDNCATRIRDIVIDNLDGELVFETEGRTDVSFRDLLHEYQTHVPWTSDGLDIILGMKTDYNASLFEQMFLPDYMMNYFDEALIKSSNGDVKPLFGDKKVILLNEANTVHTSLTPGIVFWLLFLVSLVIAYFELKRQKAVVLLNRLFLLLTGVVGCLIFFLWFLSRHSVTGENFNMLWAIPFNLFIAFLSSWFYRSKPFQYYLLFIMLCAAIPLVFGWLLPQYLPAMIYPLCLLLLSRYASWYYILTRR